LGINRKGVEMSTKVKENSYMEVLNLLDRITEVRVDNARIRRVYKKLSFRSGERFENGTHLWTKNPHKWQ